MSNNNDDKDKEMTLNQAEKAALLRNVADLAIRPRVRGYDGPPSFNQGPRGRGRPVW